MNFSLIFANHPHSIWLYDQKTGKFLDVNETAVVQYGYSKEEFLQMQITDIYFPEDAPFLSKISTLNFSGQWKHRKKNGDLINIEAVTHAIEYGEYDAKLLEIRESQKMENNLQKSEDTFRAIYQAIPVPLVISRLSDGLILYANSELVEIFRCELEDLVNHPISDLYYNPSQRKEILATLTKKKSVQNYELLLKRKDGSNFWAIASFQYLNFQGESAILAVFSDITAPKRTELAFKAQAEREQLMRTVAERIRQSLNLTDILNTTVQEVRHLLKVDRVVVYQFASDMSGKIVAESVGTGWTIALGVTIKDTCFQTGGGLQYYQGRKRAIANIYEAGLTNCHLKLLEQFEVQANLVVPILLKIDEENAGSCLWGLLVAHQCSHSRDWEEHQLDLLDQLTVQIAIAIQQSTIFQQAQNEIAERQRVEINLKSALVEKEVLLKEVHHRVKNNLQIVSSLLQLQSQTITDPEMSRVFQDSQNRIDSISLIHKNLYLSPNIGTLDVADYVDNLVTSILISYQIAPGKIDIKTHIDAVNLNVDQAIGCGLIINELLSNSFKHAFPDQKTGKIAIELSGFNNQIQMIIQDNGIGLPDNLDWSNTDSLGLSLVYDLVTEQLEGTMTVERNHGTAFKIQFPYLTLD
ncbi:histidine kinase dimerization/phosphoacceptor domain -containing protein [Nodularia harveyana UHCC-0300]|uniref:histidine kinase n=1 Tax=Nodularia harveyana UHCC-0300 TaxID=2974287 RepID=A0ABU5UJM1_9CYAN|nr:histidine kinase dimerization/phosphoacceptor domain -containing protein [Nodularia harveyana]MEA5583684.1 histidine kinase dimerization/phosphoacceptor domain -containing protein [Nodularia harveyana UHCC-0300]